MWSIFINFKKFSISHHSFKLLSWSTILHLIITKKTPSTELHTSCNYVSPKIRKLFISQILTVLKLRLKLQSRSLALVEQLLNLLDCVIKSCRAKCSTSQSWIINLIVKLFKILNIIYYCTWCYCTCNQMWIFLSQPCR
jgi:hypothetical protein